MLEVSWGEVAMIAALVVLLAATGRVATFVRGVRRGMRDDDPEIRVRFIERAGEGDEDERKGGTAGPQG